MLSESPKKNILEASSLTGTLVSSNAPSPAKGSILKAILDADMTQIYLDQSSMK